ncbi:MAG: TadE family type IV pilus minor pilin, partial [Frankiaceae bacterium]
MPVISRSGRPGEAGYATAELALTLPVIVLVVLAGLWAVSAVSLKAACAEAVRLGARAAARGEPAEVVRDVVRHELPARAAVTVGGDEPGTVRVRVSVRLRPAGALSGLLPAVSVSATAEAATETGLPAPRTRR